MGNMNQAIGMSRLMEQKPKTVSRVEMLPTEISASVFAIAQQEGRSFGDKTQDEWRHKYLTSTKFLLTEVSMNKVALPVRAGDSNLIQRLYSESARLKPVIVDVNRHKVGKTKSGFNPPVIVIDGIERFEAASLRGDTKIIAWVGAAAMDMLDISADDEMSSDELQDQLSKLIRNYQGLTKKGRLNNDIDSYIYVAKLYPFENYCIYRFQNKEYRQHYKIDQQDRSVSLLGKPIEVIQKYVDKDIKDPLHGSGTRSMENAIMQACACETQVEAAVKCTGMKGCGCAKCKAKMEAGGPGSGRHKGDPDATHREGFQKQIDKKHKFGGGNEVSKVAEKHGFERDYHDEYENGNSRFHYGDKGHSIEVNPSGIWKHYGSDGQTVKKGGKGASSLDKHLSK